MKRLSILLLLTVFMGGCATANNVPVASPDASSLMTSATLPVLGASDEVAQPDGAKLATFSTDFKNAAKSRAHNITLASKAINGSTIEPGAVFSFNDTVGPTTKANGYMLGRIFIKGKDAKGYGGGVCQVSSTLFNAAEQAGFKVTERHKHSKKVGYVGKGRDATTSYGGADFKFVNNRSYPVRINSHVDGETVTVTIERA